MIDPVSSQWSESESPAERVARQHAFASMHNQLLGSDLRSRFGRFEILELLGEGGQGQVYCAHDPQLDRAVALKILRANSEKSAERALAEGRSLARLSHPNLIPIFEVVTTEGTCALVMELAKGPTLRAWLSEGQSQRAILGTLLAVAQGLAALHRVGLVHCDVKPSNVVIDAGGTPRLVDLGLACESRPDVEATPAGGTPTYMAPEQRDADAAVGPAADQYAFAVMAWEALCAKRPDRSLDGARPRELPRGIAAILERGLQPDPASRYTSIDEMASALRRWQRRKRKLRITGAIAVAVAAATLGIGVFGAGRTDCAESAPRLDAIWTAEDREDLHGQLAQLDVPIAPEFASVVTGELDERVEAMKTLDRELCRAEKTGRDVRPQRVCLDEHASLFPFLVRSIAGLDGESLPDATGQIARLGSPLACRAPTDEVVAATVVLDGRPISVQREIREADTMCEHAGPDVCMSAFAELQTRYEPLDECSYTPQLELARGGALQLARRDEAVEHFASAAWGAESCGLAETEFIAKTRAAKLSALTRKHESAQMWLAAATAALPRVGANGQRSGRLESAASVVAFYRGEPREALAHNLRAVEHLETLSPAPDYELAVAYASAGVAARATGDFELAAELLGKGLAGLEEVHGSDHPDIAQTLGSLAHVESLRANRPAAIELLERATAILERWHRPTLLSAMLNNRASVHERLGEFEEAAKLFERAYELKKSILDESDPRLIMALSNVGRARAVTGDFEAGTGDMRRAIELGRLHLGATDNETLRAKSNLATVLFNAGHYSEAADLACAVGAIWAEQIALDHPDVRDSARLCLLALDVTFRENHARNH